MVFNIIIIFLLYIVSIIFLRCIVSGEKHFIFFYMFEKKRKQNNVN